MALVTVQRSPSPSNTPESLSSDVGQDVLEGLPDSASSSLKSPLRTRSFSESYFTVKGAALILPQSECARTVTRRPSQGGDDIRNHLQKMFYLLRPQDTIKVAVKLECSYPQLHRYLVVVSTMGRQDTEESLILGVDIVDTVATIGMVLPIWGDTAIKLDGDGGFSVTSNERHHIFKPVSVQAMWSALQNLIKVRDTATIHSYFPKGLTHTWVTYYEVRIKSDQIYINEWEAMEDIESHRPEPEQESSETIETEKELKTKLKEVMMTVDLEEVTCKYLRTLLEEEMGRNLREFRHFIDEEMIVILRQMDSPSEIFDFLYLGSEWNASNLEELKENGISYILNVTREIDNFFPGMFEYQNIRVYDVEKSELLKHWDNTYKFISKAQAENSKVLVHCKMGISRSASTVIAFAMKEYGWGLEEALDYVKKKRSCIKPNKGFMQQLVTYQGILDASKQRHSNLWRSKSVGNLSDSSTSLRATEDKEEDKYPTDFLDDMSFVSNSGSRPRSWSPEDSTTQLLIKTRHMASDDDSSEGDTNTTSIDYNAPDDLEDVNTPYFAWDDLDDLEMSSRSADELDEVFTDVPSPRYSYGQRKHPSVVLLSYKPFTGSETEESDSSDEDREVMTEESELEDFVAEENAGKPERGFYDVSMFNVLYAVSDEGIPEEQQGDTLHLNYYLHPDIKLEIMMAQIRKHRRIAQLLRLSQSELQKPEPSGVKVVQPATSKLCDIKEPLVPPNTPLFTKVRADSSWIKEIPPSPQDPPVIKEQAAPPVREQENSPLASPDSNLMSATTTDSMDNPDKSKEDFSSAAENGSEEEFSEGLEHYKKEDIPWFPGKVKQHKLDLEEKIKSGLTVTERHRKTSSSSAGSGAGSLDEGRDKPTQEPPQNIPGKDGNKVKKAYESEEEQQYEEKLPERDPVKDISTISDSGEGPAITEAERGISEDVRPTSIYESEDIPLEPGLVMRTRQEIEQRHRTMSDVSLSPEKDARPVQRSSSLKNERTTPRKDRNSERRKTCLPLLQPSPVTPNVPASVKQDSEDHIKSTETEEEKRIKVLQIGSETVEMVEGKVRKETRNWERYSECEIVRDGAGEDEEKQRSYSAPKELSQVTTTAIDPRSSLPEVSSAPSMPHTSSAPSMPHSSPPPQSSTPADSATPPDSAAKSCKVNPASPLEEEGVDIPQGSVKRQTQQIERKYIQTAISSQQKTSVSPTNSNSSDSECRDVKASVFGKPEVKVSAPSKPDIKTSAPSKPGLKARSESVSESPVTAVIKIPVSKRWSVHAKVEPSKSPVMVKRDTSATSCTAATSNIVANSNPTPTECTVANPKPLETIPKEERPGSLSGLGRSPSDSTGTGDCSGERGEGVSPVGSDSSAGTPAYKEEDITWSVGTVKQHKQAIESKHLDGSSSPLSRRKEPPSGESRLSNETLRLIREVGSNLMASSSKDRKSLGAVRKIARTIEDKSGSSPERHVIIVEKQHKKLSTKQGVVEKMKTEKPVKRSSSLKENVPTRRDAFIVSQKVPSKASQTESAKEISKPESKVKSNQTSDSTTEFKDLAGGDSLVDETSASGNGKLDRKISLKELVGIFEPKEETFSKVPSVSALSLDSAIKAESIASLERSGEQLQLPPLTKTEPSQVSEDVDKRKCTGKNTKIQEYKEKTDVKQILPPIPVGSKSKSFNPPEKISLPELGTPAQTNTSQDICGSDIKRPSSAELPSRPSSFITSPSSPNSSSSSGSSFEMKSPGASGINRVPINSQREPDPTEVPRKTRRQQGKTHPLSKLTQDSPPPSGRSANPFHNTM